MSYCTFSKPTKGLWDLTIILPVTCVRLPKHWVSYLFIGGPASGHKHYVETSEASNRDEEQTRNTHYS